MSHRDDCPDRWEARREGERAFERGYGSNPYRGDEGCPEAEQAWRSGYYAAESAERERHEEEYWDRRRAEARAEEEACEARMMEEAQAQAEYERQAAEAYDAEMRAAQEQEGDPEA